MRSLEGKLRIGNAERSVLVALAHAAVLNEKGKFYWQMFADLLTTFPIAGKKWSKEKLTKRMEEAAEIMKSVYRWSPSFTWNDPVH